MLGIEHAHHERGERHQEDERIHDARQRHRQMCLVSIEARCKQGDEQRRDQDPEHAQCAQHDGGQRRDLVRKTPCGAVTVGGDGLGKGGDERGRQRSFGKQVAQQVRRAERHGERVHGASAAKECREDLLADQAKNTAAHDRKPDDACRPGADCVVRGVPVGSHEQVVRLRRVARLRRKTQSALC